jgi:proline dehydrogenase
VSKQSPGLPPWRVKVGLPRRVVLRFSIRGSSGETEHALVAVMTRRDASLNYLDAQKPQWRLRRLELRAHGRARVIPRRKITRDMHEDLAMQAERKAYAVLGMRIPAEGF